MKSNTYYSTFNGSTQYIGTSGSYSALTCTGDFTIEGWFKPTSTPASQVNLFALGTETTNRYVFYMNAGVIYGNLYGGAAFSYGGSLSAGKWYHIAFVRVGSKITCYVDGVPTANKDTQAGTIGNGQITIGSDAAAGGKFTGSISNVRLVTAPVYNTKFTPSGPLTNIPSTKFLSLQSATIVDNSITAVTLTNNGTVTSTNDVTTITRAGDCGGNSGLVFSSKTVYMVGGTTNTYFGSTIWAPTSGGTAAAIYFPLPQDTAMIDNNSGSATTVLNLSGSGGNFSYSLPNIDATNRTTNLTMYAPGFTAGVFYYGDLKLSSSVVFNAVTLNNTFSGRGSKTWIMAGNNHNGPLNIECVTGSLTFGDSFLINSTAYGINVTSGTLTAVSNVTVGYLYLATTASTYATYGNLIGTGQIGSSYITINMGSGVWTFISAGTILNIPATTVTYTTINKNTSSMIASHPSSTANMNPNINFSFGKLTIAGGTNSANFTFTASGSFDEIASTRTVAYTISLSASVVITVGNWTATGTAAAPITIIGVSNGTGSMGYLVYTGSTPITGINYLILKFLLLVQPSLYWYVGPNTTIANGVGGMIFSTANAAVVVTATSANKFFMLFDF
jgi:hypothetical protein